MKINEKRRNLHVCVVKHSTQHPVKVRFERGDNKVVNSFGFYSCWFSRSYLVAHYLIISTKLELTGHSGTWNLLGADGVYLSTSGSCAFQ